MLIEDAPLAPEGRVLVRGATDAGSVRMGDVLLLTDADGSSTPVILRGMRVIGRYDGPTREGLLLELEIGDDLTAGVVSVGQRLIKPPEDGVGVREPLRPVVPASSAAARADQPSGQDDAEPPGRFQ